LNLPFYGSTYGSAWPLFYKSFLNHLRQNDRASTIRDRYYFIYDRLKMRVLGIVASTAYIWIRQYVAKSRIEPEIQLQGYPRMFDTQSSVHQTNYPPHELKKTLDVKAQMESCRNFWKCLISIGF